MEYVMLSDRFGGLNTYLNPDKLGPGGAQEMFGCDVTRVRLRVRSKRLVRQSIFKTEIHKAQTTHLKR